MIFAFSRSPCHHHHAPDPVLLEPGVLLADKVIKFVMVNGNVSYDDAIEAYYKENGVLPDVVKDEYDERKIDLLLEEISIVESIGTLAGDDDSEIH